MTMSAPFYAALLYTGTIPPEWGVNGSFPQLRALSLNNTELRGTLPPEWGNPPAMPLLDAL